MSDSFSTFKLPSYPCPNATIISSSSAPHITSNPYYCFCARCTNLLSSNDIHHLGEEEGGIITSSSRWSPTPAQLLYLEQLYTQGTKTPTVQQIQLIASQLRRFGNIQAKNVFYWFQNHKARDRHYLKRRRFNLQITSPPPPSAHQHQQQKHQFTETLMLQSPQDALQGYEVKATNKWASPSNCSALAQVSDPLDIAERGAYRRTEREERETQILKMKREESQEVKCQSRYMFCFLSNSKNVIKSITTTSTTNTQTSNPTNYYCNEEEVVADNRTLTLFPLKTSDDGDDDEGTESGKHKFCYFNNIASIVSDEITSKQFFEFLPLRN